MLLGGGVILAIILLIKQFHEIDNGLLVYFPFYVAGLIVNEKVMKKICKYPIAIVSFVLWIIMAFLFPNHGFFLYYLKQIIISILGIYIILYASYKIQVLAEYDICRKIIDFFAYISLALYLFHRHVYLFLSFLFVKMGFSVEIWVLFFVYLPIAIAVSYIIQRLYDGIIKAVYTH